MNATSTVLKVRLTRMIDHEFVRKANDAFLKELDDVTAKFIEELSDAYALNDTGCSLARNICAGTFIPSFARKQGKCTAIR